MNHRSCSAKKLVLSLGFVLALTATPIAIAQSSPKKTEKASQDQNSDNRYQGDGSRIRAFPGAEGFGAYSKGGRGGKVIYVTNLNDSGPGSFREACNTKGPRTVIFRVGGVIALKKELKVVEPYMTIAGQTAPGDGICLKGDRFKIDAHDIVVRYLRSRLGDETRREEDSIATYTNGYDVILDHCSASWSIDETLSTTHARNVTVQWCIISESLNNSFHKKGKHGYGSLIWGAPITFHHNLYAHHSDRVPRPGTFRNQPYPTFLDFRNNVIYDFGAGGYCHGENMQVNYVGNYIKPPGGKGKHAVFEVRKQKKSTGGSTRIHLADNLHLGSAEASKDNGLLLKVHATSGTVKEVLTEKPFPVPLWAAVKTDSAEKAYERILDECGAILPRRDAVDKRVLEQLKNGKGKIIDSQNQVGGYPQYQSGEPYKCSANDGIADDWKRKRGQKPEEDLATRVADDGYTYLEHFFNGTEPAKKK